MPGKNQLLEKDQTLFQEGDDSDGMYLVRKGQLLVYLHRDGKDVKLATVEAGSLIGEMALFDHKPRSASVKALTAAEVTLISNKDFASMVKMIPKWFTALMSTLSGRLRQTNERLEKLQTKVDSQGASKQSIKTLYKALNILDIIWHRDGVKNGKSRFISNDSLVSILNSQFLEDPTFYTQIIEKLTKAGICDIQGSPNFQYSLTNPAMLSRYLEHLDFLMKNNRPLKLPKEAFWCLKLCTSLAKKAPYETMVFSADDFAKEAKQREKPLEDPAGCVKKIAQINPLLEYQASTSDGHPGFKLNKKHVERVLLIQSISQKLARLLV